MNENELLIESIKALIEEIKRNTEAINSLSISMSIKSYSNFDDIDFDEEAEKEAQTTYLDGTPIAN